MSTRIDARLAALGIELPPGSKPVANYLGCKQVGALLYVGGHGPVTAGGITRGKVGGTVSVEEARDAAKAFLQAISKVKVVLPDDLLAATTTKFPLLIMAKDKSRSLVPQV